MIDRKKYKQLRIIVIFFVSALIGLAIIRDNYILAAAAILTGMVFMALARSQAKLRTDEREITIQEKAARMTYAIFAPTIGISAFLLLLPSKSGLSIFAKGNFMYSEYLGMVFAYLTLFLIAIYAISYHFFNTKYGGKSDEE